jgi:hypothetical protein
MRNRRAGIRAIALGGLLLLSAPAAGAAGLQDGASPPLREESGRLEARLTLPRLTTLQDLALDAPEIFALERFNAGGEGRWWLLGLAGGLVLLWAIALRQRGRGGISLEIVFPKIVEGEFEVSLRRRSTRPAAQRPIANAHPKRSRAP